MKDKLEECPCPSLGKKGHNLDFVPVRIQGNRDK
nr:MAG TPA: hypothetical protein [Caudoviricetes sp.]